MSDEPLVESEFAWKKWMQPTDFALVNDMPGRIVRVILSRSGRYAWFLYNTLFVTDAFTKIIDTHTGICSVYQFEDEEGFRLVSDPHMGRNFYWLDDSTIVGVCARGPLTQYVFTINHETRMIKLKNTFQYSPDDGFISLSFGFPRLDLVHNREKYVIWISRQVIQMIPYSPYKNTTPKTIHYDLPQNIAGNRISGLQCFGYQARIFFLLKKEVEHVDHYGDRLAYFDLPEGEINENTVLSDLKLALLTKTSTQLLDEESFIFDEQMNSYQCGPDGRYLLLVENKGYFSDSPSTKMCIVDLELLSVRHTAIPHCIGSEFNIMHDRIIQWNRDWDTKRPLSHLHVVKLSSRVPRLVDLCRSYLKFGNHNIVIPEHIYNFLQC